MPSLKFLVGGIALLVAIAVGTMASYHSYRGARGPRERAYVLRVSLYFWGLILSMLGLVYYLPSPYRFAPAAAYFIGLPLLVYRWAKNHQLIRVMEAREGA